MEEMKGYLITYNSSSRKDITKINYFLFGRVATIKRANKKERYYYPGFFEQTPYKKVSNGCYFVKEINDNFDGLLNIYPSTIEFKDAMMYNARDFWRDKVDSTVNNW